MQVGFIFLELKKKDDSTVGETHADGTIHLYLPNLVDKNFSIERFKKRLIRYLAHEIVHHFVIKWKIRCKEDVEERVAERFARFVARCVR